LTAWSTAVPDWEERLLAGRSLIPSLPLFEAEAERALRVFKRLKVPDVIGKPPMAEAGALWFFDLVRVVFGSYDPATNTRRISEYFVLVPKKNGKSSYSAALVITALIVNRRPAAEFLIVAPTKKIADISFRQAELTIRADPALADLFHCQTHIRRITHRGSDALAEIKAADTDAITGGKNTYALIDETHEFASSVRAADVFLEIRGALAARPDGFLIQLTTQSKKPPAGVFKDELEIARQVRDGKIERPLLPVLYELPLKISADGGWKNRALWPLVNPNLGRSVSETFLVTQLADAEIKGASALALLASQHFNVEIGLALGADRWAGADFWLQATDPALTLETLLARSEVVVIGLDGGGLDDLLGLSVVGREKATGRWLAWGRAFAHISALRRRKSIAPELIDFARAGDLEVFDAVGRIPADDLSDLVDKPDAAPDAPSPADEPAKLPPDVQAVAALVQRVLDSGLLAIVGIDPYGVGLIVEGLKTVGVCEREAGKDDDPLVPLIGVSQGYKLMGPIRTAERKLADRTLLHAPQPLLSWAVGNAKTEMKGNATMITKAAAGALKIDPLMALLTAIGLMSTNPEPAGSVYSAERGLVVFG
jgi:phage terminase large subunit-like protein